MNNEKTLEFIEDYRSYECLWDVNNKSYTNKNKRNDAYADLGKKYGLTEKAVRNKIKSLRSYFSKENQNMSVRKSGSGTDSKYESTWFAYQPLLFIADSVTQTQTKDSLNIDVLESINLGEGNIDSAEDNDENTMSCGLSFTTRSEPPVSSVEGSVESVVRDTTTSVEPSCTKRKLLKRKRDEGDKKEEEALNFLRTATTVLAEKDDCTIFGQMVASELRKLDPKNKAIVKNEIQNLIFDFQIREIDEFQQPPPFYPDLGSSSCASTSNSDSHMSSSAVVSDTSCIIQKETEEFLIFNLDQSD